VMISVSLDIKNAFNFLSWNSIRWALEKKKVTGLFEKDTR